MCGICAYIGLSSGYHNVIDGLVMLQNRGYDSAGISSISDGKIIVTKYASCKENNGVTKLQKNSNNHCHGTTIIGHTRWATHGPKTDTNAHPHMDYTGKFSIVHNGIIENYLDLKNELKDIKFKSQTDTEVIANLIGYYYQGDPEEAINKTINRLEGTWGLVIMCTDFPDRLFCARHGSPLLIGFGDNFMMVASEQSGFCRYVNNYICLNDNDIITLKYDTFTKMHEYDIHNVTIDSSIISPDPHKHWTLKEIYDQGDVALRAMGLGGRILNDYSVRLGGLYSHIKNLNKLDHLIILGCGTSYFAGMYSLHILKQITSFDTIQLFDGADFTKYDIPRSGKTGIILMSQSGETRDLYLCIKIAKEFNLFMIGVINVVDSLIAREVNCGVYLNSGREVGVASTKVFTSQIIVMTMIALWFAQIKNINEGRRYKVIEGLRRLPIDIKTTIDRVRNQCKIVANYLKDKKSLFILGKGQCESIAKEGALKIKEIGYIHAEGYSSSALKHGPYSLIEQGVPIIIIANDDEYYNKNYSTIEEVKSRGAHVIVISDRYIKNENIDIIINIPNNNHFRDLLAVIPMQLIAYELACIKGHNPDFPRNLSKSVVVS